MPKIAAKDSNKNVTIAPHGTGKVVVGTGAADATLQSDGDHNLVLQTGNSTTSKIEITDGANGDVAITPNGTGNLTIDNIAISDNTIKSTDTNGNIDITPNGTGEVNISKVDIDSGTIDGATIATSDVTVGTGKTLNVSVGALTTSTVQKQAIVDGASIEGTDILSTGESGSTKFLRENATSPASWETVSTPDSLPSQTGNANKILTTDGSAASWTDAPNSLVKLAFAGQSSAPGSPSAGTVYYNSTENLLYVWNNTQWSPLVSPYVQATGPDGAAGVEDGDYKYHLFTVTKTGSAGFIVSSPGSGVEYLVIGGGGGSGGQGGGGGGGGGYRTETGHSVSVGSYNITVGAGGSGGAQPSSGGDATQGGSSIFDTITSAGGGFGGGYNIGTAGSGGSGGGIGAGTTTASGGAASPAGQGNTGGGSHTSAAGGGGGATNEGVAGATGSVAGRGGAGITDTMTGSSVGRGGGGGGASHLGSGGTASDGGGAGVLTSADYGGAGTANTGGGSGGSINQPGVVGGTGVVIIRYKFKT